MPHRAIIAGIFFFVCMYFALAYPNSPDTPKGALFFISGVALIVMAYRFTPAWIAGGVMMLLGYLWPWLTR
jgi:hypothetical protein